MPIFLCAYIVRVYKSEHAQVTNPTKYKSQTHFVSDVFLRNRVSSLVRPLLTAW